MATAAHTLRDTGRPAANGATPPRPLSSTPSLCLSFYEGMQSLLAAFKECRLDPQCSVRFQGQRPTETQHTENTALPSTGLRRAG